MDISATGVQKPGILVLWICALGVLAGCGGGTKLLKNPLPVEITQSLSRATDQHILASLDWVIVRDRAGTWARNADWDEYLISVTNQSETAISLIEVAVIDSLGARSVADADRKRLVRASKKTVKRYKQSNLRVKAGAISAGAGPGGLLIGGVAAGIAGTAIIAGTAEAAIYGSSAAGAATAAAGAAVLLAPVLIVGGIMRDVNSAKVASEIESRHTALPASLAAGEVRQLDIFFPVAPSPAHLEIVYRVADSEETLIVNTRELLNGLHLVPRDK